MMGYDLQLYFALAKAKRFRFYPDSNADQPNTDICRLGGGVQMERVDMEGDGWVTHELLRTDGLFFSPSSVPRVIRPVQVD